MSFTGRVIVISMNGKYRDGDIDVFILIVDMVESAIAVSDFAQGRFKVAINAHPANCSLASLSISISHGLSP